MMTEDAIEQLKQIHINRNVKGDYLCDTYEAIDLAIKALEQSRWILCKDRITIHEALCCDAGGDIMIGYMFESSESATGYSAENNESYMYECVAWMPLPEPYTESEEK